MRHVSSSQHQIIDFIKRVYKVIVNISSSKKCKVLEKCKVLLSSSTFANCVFHNNSKLYTEFFVKYG